MLCPNCGSEHYEQYGRPVRREPITFRRHRCLECQFVFASAQAILSGEVADVMEEILERRRTSVERAQ